MTNFATRAGDRRSLPSDVSSNQRAATTAAWSPATVKKNSRGFLPGASIDDAYKAAEWIRGALGHENGGRGPTVSISIACRAPGLPDSL